MDACGVGQHIVRNITRMNTTVEFNGQILTGCMKLKHSEPAETNDVFYCSCERRTVNWSSSGRFLIYIFVEKDLVWICACWLHIVRRCCLYLYRLEFMTQHVNCVHDHIIEELLVLRRTIWHLKEMIKSLLEIGTCAGANLGRNICKKLGCLLVWQNRP